jgi:mRNA interferase MazF
VHVLIEAGPDTGLRVASVASFDQIRTVNRVRLIRRLGSVDDETMERVDEAIKISLGVTRLD